MLRGDGEINTEFGLAVQIDRSLGKINIKRDIARSINNFSSERKETYQGTVKQGVTLGLGPRRGDGGKISLNRSVR